MAVDRDLKDRSSTCKPEIDFVLERKEDCGVLVRQQESGELPLRVTHNDTKLNNILFDSQTGKGLCIIDLDTIMPGLRPMISEIPSGRALLPERRMRKIWIWYILTWNSTRHI